MSDADSKESIHFLGKGVDQFDTDTSGSNDNKTRGRWGGRFEFLLAIVGYTVAVGSIWRFPMYCAKNGGGAFLIPFTFFVITCGGPLYYLEVCLGQFTGKSAVGAFEFCPLFKGLGFLMVLLSFVVTWYIMAVLMWILYFLYCSFFPVLPWTTCGNWWNTANCTDNLAYTVVSEIKHLSSNGSMGDVTSPHTNTTLTQELETNTTDAMQIGSVSSPAYEFWMYNVLRKSDNLENFGGIQVHLVICLFIGWLLVVLAVLKGVKTLGKVVYVTATLPYILLTVMLIRGLTLDGATDGIIYFVTPDFQKILNFQVWLDAAVQIFFSLGPTWGGVITMASFNEFHKKTFRDTVICVSADLFTNFYSGLVVFCIIGFMARESHTSVEEMVKVTGPGLVFVAYPTAISRMPVPNLWAILFFLMMITVAFDTNFAMFETVTSAIIDTFPRHLVSRRPAVNIISGAIFFLIGLPFTCKGSLYLFQLLDWYSAAFALVFGSSLEIIVVSWIYGADRFSSDISIMTGRETSVLLRILWVFVIPLCMLVAMCLMLWGYSLPDYGDGYVYEPYAITLGFIIGLLPIAALVANVVWEVVKAEGSLYQRLQHLLQPSDAWGPADRNTMKLYKQTPYIHPDTFIDRVLLNIRGSKGTPWF